MSTSADIPNRVLLRVDEVADIFRVSIQTIYNWKNNGTLPCVKKLGQPIRFRRDVIIQILAEEE
jgi:excisionase family DNA binding protein